MGTIIGGDADPTAKLRGRGVASAAEACGIGALTAGRGQDVGATRATGRDAGFATAFVFELKASTYQQRSDLFSRTV
jgi:hypothetical protein